MRASFDAELNAQVTQDSDGRVRAIRYPDEFAESDQDSPLAAAIAYVQHVAGVFDLGAEQLDNIHVQSTHLDPAGTAGMLAGGLFNIGLRGTGLVALVSDGDR